MNWNKIYKTQNLFDVAKVENIREDGTIKYEDNLLTILEQSNLNFLATNCQKDFRKSLLLHFIWFISEDGVKISRGDISLLEFSKYLKNHDFDKKLIGFDIRDQTHLDFLLQLVNERFKEIPFEFSKTHILKYKNLSKFQRNIKFN